MSKKTLIIIGVVVVLALGFFMTQSAQKPAEQAQEPAQQDGLQRNGTAGVHRAMECVQADDLAWQVEAEHLFAPLFIDQVGLH